MNAEEKMLKAARARSQGHMVGVTYQETVRTLEYFDSTRSTRKDIKFVKFCSHLTRETLRSVEELFFGDDDQGIRPDTNYHITCDDPACIAAANAAIKERRLGPAEMEAAIAERCRRMDIGART